MSKILFYTPQTIIPADGVSKKVFGQVQAMKNLGHEVHFIYPMQSANTLDLFLNGETFVQDMYHSLTYNKIEDYVKHNKIEIVFIRYVVIASPRFLAFLRNISKCVNKILIEIPTYPYDGELKCSSLGSVIHKYKEIICRQFLHRWVDYVLTYATDNSIYNIPCIHISNAPAYKLPTKKEKSLKDAIKMIAVANIASWHGYDRLIEGLGNYYKSNVRREVILSIVGGGDKATIELLKNKVKVYNLQRCIQFLGSKDGADLDILFDEADLAIGSLGRHRNGIKQLKTLKNVEYAMRGIPFVYSEDNKDFDGKPYVFKVPADESPININDLVNFIEKVDKGARDISQDVCHMTWENQFSKVFKIIGV